MIGQLIQALLGVWLMFAPSVLDFEGTPAATNYRIVGPIMVALAGVAFGECTRSVRLWNIPFAVWIVLSPILISSPTIVTLVSVATGSAMLILCFVRGREEDHYGGGWIVLFQKQSQVAQQS